MSCGLRILAVFGLLLGGTRADDRSPWKVPSPRVASDARVVALLREVESARREALELLEDSFGLTPGSRPIEWRLEAPAPQESTGAFHVGETTVRKDRVVVTLPPARYLTRPRHARRVVVHEAAHALLGSRLGPEAYRALAPWFREGFALLVSGEGQERVAARIATTLVGGGDPDAFLRGLGSGASPAESFLAVEGLRQELGRDRFRSVISSISRGGDLESELTRTLGRNPREIGQALRKFTREQISRSVTAEVSRGFRLALESYRSSDLAAARRRFDRLAKVSGHSAVTSTISYFRARLLVLSGEHAGASRELRSLLRVDREVLWEPEILEQLGNCSFALNRRREADRYFDEVLERFPEDRAVCDRVLRKRSRDR